MSTLVGLGVMAVVIIAAVVGTKRAIARRERRRRTQAAADVLAREFGWGERPHQLYPSLAYDMARERERRGQSPPPRADLAPTIAGHREARDTPP